MINFEKVGQELERRGKTGELQRLAQSPDGQKLGKLVDPAAVERAAKSGDSAALAEMMKKLLSTAEGQRLAAELRRTMEK